MMDTSKQTGVYAPEINSVVVALLDINETLRAMMTQMEELDKSICMVASAVDNSTA